MENMASSVDLVDTENDALKLDENFDVGSTEINRTGLYQQLKFILNILPISDELQKTLLSVCGELDTLWDTDSEELRSAIISFVLLLPSLKPDQLNIGVGVQLFQHATSVIQKLSHVHYAFSIVYCVIVIGMALFNKQSTGKNIETTLKEILREQSDNDMLNECEGIKCTLTKYAHMLCGMGVKKLKTHEVSAVAAMVPIGDGFATMGKLAKRIRELRDEEHDKYCSTRTSNYERIIRYIQVYCCLDTVKRGILMHIYALFKFSDNSPNLIKGVKAVVEQQQDENRQLLAFLVRPSRENAIIHFSGNISTHEIIEQYLDDHNMRMDDLDYLCKGVYHIKPLRYEDAKMYMANNTNPGLKFVRWTYTKSVPYNKTLFTFNRASIGGNHFHVHSYSQKEYHVRAVLNGMWIDGTNGDPSTLKSTWKIIPTDYKGKSKCYLIAPKDCKNVFLFAGCTGRICVQKFTKSEYEQVLWHIEEIEL